jgi:hypothetical protein
MQPGRVRTLRDISLISAMAVCSGFAALASLPGASASQPQPVAAVFAPWTSGEEAMARSLAAGARVLRLGAAPFVVVLAPEPDAAMPVARPAGALLLLRLDGLAGCLVAPETGLNRA